MAGANDVRAGGAVVEFSAKGQQVVQTAVKSVQGSLDSLARKATWIGASLMAAGASITGPMLYGMSVGAEWARELVGGARRTGVAFEQLGTLSYALNTDVDSLSGVFRKMNSFLAEAAHGSQEANRHLGELGLNLADLERLTPDEQLRRFADAIDRVGNSAERGNHQTAILGRNAMGLNFSGGAAGIRSREERGRSLGASMPPEEMEIFRQYNAASRDMGVAQKALWASIGAAAPAMTELFVIITNVMVSVRGWTQENRPLLDIIFRVADKVVLLGGVIIGLSAILVGGSYAVGFFGSAIGVAFGLVNFLAGALGINTAAMLIYKLSIWGVTAAWGVLKFILLSAAGGFGLLGIGMAISKAFMWAYTLATVPATAGTTALTGGINLLTAALILLGAVGVAALIVPIASLGYFAYILLEATGTTRALARETVNAGSQIGSAFAAAGRQTRDSFVNMLTGMIGDAEIAWGGISAALSVGDWEALWDILQTTAKLEWIRISAFGIDTWEAWKFAAITTWLAITDGFQDAWRDSWAGIRGLFAIGMGMIEAGWWRLAASIVDALGTPIRTVRRLLGGLARAGGPLAGGAQLAYDALGGDQDGNSLRARADRAERGGEDRAAQIENQRRADERESADDREQRDLDRGRIQVEMQAARAAGNQPEIERLEQHLFDVAQIAAMHAAGQDRRLSNMGHDAQDGFQAGRGMVQGTFSAAAASYFVTSETPAMRQERLLTEANSLADAANARLEELIGVVRNIPGFVMG